jgi:hypothetical protein
MSGRVIAVFNNQPINTQLFLSELALRDSIQRFRPNWCQQFKLLDQIFTFIDPHDWIYIPGQFGRFLTSVVFREKNEFLSQKNALFKAGAGIEPL